ncbi:3-oxoacyl-[acyl-carrier-protein] synthase III C-terminal domain-containing protein [Nonomuraea soli]|uniref:3-oxoacyl-[acyl-carrier-protein] synthase-3 n=1 Tax=Nonomuraea soli TaxID=1032476 RepID=A0A7W0CFN5_9ACTN|nr:3-oxoacyl-[acyl-carrier-protein] synthase III C-terminal domain-containing protein [Nonomuraea soli]MBA2890251.1 3-oxoacyl-[acyl-carrier-protein] synthase-3 [Nonomuraea soli]
MSFGIAEFGYAFGETQEVASVAADYVPDPARIMRWGYTSFHRAPKDVHAVQLAAQAAEDALKRAGMTADELGMVVYAYSDQPEYPHWDSSAALARELRTPPIQTLLLSEGCASGVTGLGLIAGQLAVQPELDNILFVAVHRTSEFHRNRMTVNDSVHSDAAVAVILKRGHEGNRWLATSQITDPDLCDFFRSEYGGSVAPLPPAGWDSRTAPNGMLRVQNHFGRNPKRLVAFVGVLEERVVQVVDDACRRAGVKRADLARVIYINDNQSSMQAMANALQIPVERTNAALSALHGHMGVADQLISLGEHLERGEVGKGDLVALCGIASGMRWHCSLVRI